MTVRTWRFRREKATVRGTLKVNLSRKVKTKTNCRELHRREGLESPRLLAVAGRHSAALCTVGAELRRAVARFARNDTVRRDRGRPDDQRPAAREQAAPLSTQFVSHARAHARWSTLSDGWWNVQPNYDRWNSRRVGLKGAAWSPVAWSSEQATIRTASQARASISCLVRKNDALSSSRKSPIFRDSDRDRTRAFETLVLAVSLSPM